MRRANVCFAFLCRVFVYRAEFGLDWRQHWAGPPAENWPQSRYLVSWVASVLAISRTDSGKTVLDGKTSLQKTGNFSADRPTWNCVF